MARPRTIDDEDLLAAARAVLLERGAGATTADVARRAGVSEGTLFKRFNTKAELFRAAVRVEPPAWVGAMFGSIGRGEIKANLKTITVQAIEFFRTAAPMAAIAQSLPTEGGVPDVFAVDAPPPLLALRGVSDYFAAEIQAGRITAADPSALARVFLGVTETFELFEKLEKYKGLPTPTPEDFADEFVETWFAGLTP